jgi:hypothetical protein
MSKKKEIDSTYYDTHSFYGDMVEAKKNGTLIVVREGESLTDGIKRLREAQKKVSVSARLPAGIVSKGKAQAAAVGVSWPS